MGRERKKQLVGKQLFGGFYINELILKLVQRSESCKILFSDYELTLKNLASFPEMQEVHLRRFEFAILKEIGVMPDFSEHLVLVMTNYILVLNREFFTKTR